MPGMNQVNAPAAAKLKQRGDNVDLPAAPAGGYAAGQMVQTPGGFLGIVNSPVVEGRKGAASISGIYWLPNSGITPAAGTQVAVDLTNQQVVATTLGDLEAGVVEEQPAAGTDPIAVHINQKPVA